MILNLGITLIYTSILEFRIFLSTKLTSLHLLIQPKYHYIHKTLIKYVCTQFRLLYCALRKCLYHQLYIYLLYSELSASLPGFRGWNLSLLFYKLIEHFFVQFSAIFSSYSVLHKSVTCNASIVEHRSP